MQRYHNSPYGISASWLIVQTAHSWMQQTIDVDCVANQYTAGTFRVA
jgi:hypothetical protein